MFLDVIFIFRMSQKFCDRGEVDDNTIEAHYCELPLDTRLRDILQMLQHAGLMLRLPIFFLS